MTSLAVDLLDGLSSSVAVKGPCACATTANITLSGEQTIDGIVTDESRVLVKDQTDQTENGIWISSTGDWRRASDFSRNDDVAKGTRVWVTAGTNSGPAEYAVTTADPIVFDTSNIAFAISLESSVATDLAATIHGATSKATPVDADELGIWDSVANGLKKLTWANLKATLVTAWGALIAAVTGKSTPVDADGFAIFDSAAANATKMVTLTNLWANYLKAKADALYATLASVVTAATQSDQETATSTSTYVSPGRQQYHPSAAKFWANVSADGTTLNVNYNVSGIVDTGAGDLTVTIGTDFSSATWAHALGGVTSIPAAGAAGTAARYLTTGTKAAGTLQLVSAKGSDGSAVDPFAPYNVVGFGDQ